MVSSIGLAPPQGANPTAQTKIRSITAFFCSRVPEDRNVFSSLTQAKMMIRVLESNRKKRRNRRPIFARRQCRNAGPIVLPCRYSSRFGSLGTASKISFESAANSRTLALDSNPCGPCCRARWSAACSFCSCSDRHSWKSRFQP